MRALFIGSDPSLFTPESPARLRMQEYAAAIGTLFIISPAPRDADAMYARGVQEGNLTIISVKGGKLLALFWLMRCAKRCIREQGIEIVSAQDPFEHGYVALRAVRGTETKLHIQVHTDFASPWFTRSAVMRAAKVPMPLLNAVRLRIADAVIPRADGIRAVSERIQSSLVARYGDTLPPVSVIPIATSPTLPQALPLPPHTFAFALMTVGRLEPEKRIEDIIDAIARIHRTYPSVGLFVVGEGRSRAALERRARALGLTDHVVFLGWRTDALALMRSAQAYIQASAYEGYGRTLLEAALVRLPIITTDVGIVGEVFTGYEDVLVAPPGDPAALAVHIQSLVEDVQARSMLAMHAEQKVQAHLASVLDQPARIANELQETMNRA
ncbi:MAG: glycosyltransferase [Patescibacteria group bacterium]